MTRLHPTCKFLLKCFIIVYLQCRNVQSVNQNNYTLIRLINSMSPSWRTGKNPKNLSPNPNATLEEETSSVSYMVGIPLDLPIRVFDARWFTPCRRIFNNVRNQGICSSSWALTTVSVISDRICIYTGGNMKVRISGEDLLTCCVGCLTEDHKCKGGAVSKSFDYLVKRGVVTEGCKPYSNESFRGEHVNCLRRCTNRTYQKNYREDKFFSEAYMIGDDETSIQKEILTHGPVLARFRLYDDFLLYRKGIYYRISGRFRGYYYIKVIGWGVALENKVLMKYWLLLDSRGRKWGDKGSMQFLRGVNECGIEEFVVGFTPEIAREPIHRRLEIDHSGVTHLQFSWTKYVYMEVVIVFAYNSL